MTFKDLKTELEKLTPEQLNETVWISNNKRTDYFKVTFSMDDEYEKDYQVPTLRLADSA